MYTLTKTSHGSGWHPLLVEEDVVFQVKIVLNLRLFARKLSINRPVSSHVGVAMHRHRWLLRPANRSATEVPAGSGQLGRAMTAPKDPCMELYGINIPIQLTPTDSATSHPN